jgi:2,4-dienoyl-CoA reductase-like NADH-dependent reductase (Old Yellow Enzyme family)
MTDVSVLFQPFESPKLSLKTRIAMAPMTRGKSPGFIPNDDVVAYYRRRAENHVGLIITEGTTINHPAAAGFDDVPVFYGEALQGWKKVVDAVHAAGGKIAPQLWHVGSVRKPGVGPIPQAPGIGPSGLIFPGKYRGEAMTQKDIDDVVNAFAQAALDAKNIGCDAIEIHGAHGYLIDQFFWEALNQRNDHYAGSIENRARFCVEILQATRARVGNDFPIILRFSQWKQQDYNARLVNSPAELERFLKPLVDAGVDIFHASTRRLWEAEFEGSALNLAGWVKKITGKPTISVGSVGIETDFLETNFTTQDARLWGISGIDELLKRMQANEFDLIAIGRALLQDPTWATKIRDGRLDEIEPYTKASVDTLY